MRRLAPFALLALTLVLAACSGSPTVTASNSPSNASASEPAAKDGSTPASGTEQVDDAKQPPIQQGEETLEPETADEKKMPANLKHEGFEYSGLGSGQPLTYTVKRTGFPDGEGTMTTQFLGIKDGKAGFARKREGDVASLGDDTVGVSADGVYVESMTSGSLGKPTLELPKDLAVGKTWSDKVEIEVGGQKVTQSANYKVAKEEAVKTGIGTVNAKLITVDGTITNGDTKSPLNAKFWYAKDVGLVKMTMSVKAGDVSQEFSLELKKRGS